MSNFSRINPGPWNGTDKRCLDCGETKPLSDFAPAKRRLDGRASYCRPCMNVRSAASAHKKRAVEGRPVRPRRIVPAGQRWCPDCQVFKSLEEFPRSKSGREGRGGYCKPCHNARSRKTRERLYGGQREYHLRRRYGIGQADVDRMLIGQGGTCPVCSKPNPEHVDHDHLTGKVRGLLCFNCNQALGNVRDKAQVLESLVDYLAVARHGRAPQRAYFPPLGVIVRYAGRSHPGSLDKQPAL